MFKLGENGENDKIAMDLKVIVTLKKWKTMNLMILNLIIKKNGLELH
jgi:hypothetical protein